jgi:hypothetical protein
MLMITRRASGRAARCGHRYIDSSMPHLIGLSFNNKFDGEPTVVLEVDRSSSFFSSKEPYFVRAT